MYQRKDVFYTRAKATGYRSRAAFKLLELAQRYRIFRRGDRVLDLGAWPGGWLQVASDCVGPNGKVLGVDLQSIEPLSRPNVMTLVGDVATESVRAQIMQACQGRVDVILSDLAPKLTGVRARDEVETQALVECVFGVAEKILEAEGTLVMKIFMSDQLQHDLGRLRRRFASVRTTRPEATRKGSAEIYVIASGYRHPAAC